MLDQHLPELFVFLDSSSEPPLIILVPFCSDLSGFLHIVYQRFVK